jgi:hypothetical protein
MSEGKLREVTTGLDDGKDAESAEETVEGGSYLQKNIGRNGNEPLANTTGRFFGEDEAQLLARKKR